MIPILLGGAALIAAAIGAKKGYDAKVDFDRAECLNTKAQDIFDQAKDKIKSKRKETQATLEQLGKFEIHICQKTLAPWAERI